MKKIISILLVFCMLLTMFVVPAVATETEETVAYEDTTLGSYYKFTFGEDEVYNYVPNYTDSEDTVGAVEYKDNVFYPYWSSSKVVNQWGTDQSLTAGYKNLVTADGKSYDALRLTAFANSIFTPVTKDGQPYEMTPGKTYTIKLKMFIPRASNWSQGWVVLGNNDQVVSGTVKNINTSATQNVLYPYSSASLKFSIVGGGNFAYNFADGEYDENTVLGVCRCLLGDNCPQKNIASTNPENGVYGRHDDKSSSKIYRDVTFSYTVPEVFNELSEGNSYFAYLDNANTADVTEEIKYNNYLSFYLGGGNVNGYNTETGSSSQGFHYSDNADTTSRIPCTYDIVSIEVYENGVGTVNFNEANGKVNSVSDAAGETAALYIPEIPADKDYFIGWYSDADFTTLVTAAPTITEGAPTELYARFGNYSKSAITDYSSAVLADEANVPLAYAYLYDNVYYATTRTNGNAAYHGRYDQPNHTVKNGTLLSSKGGNGYTNYSGRDELGYAYASFKDYTGFTTYGDMAVGDTAKSGWGQADYVTVRNADGTPYIVKPNSKYEISVVYKITDTFEGDTASMNIGIGMKNKEAASKGTGYSHGTTVYNKVSFDVVKFSEGVSEDFVTKTVTLDSGDLAGAVPVIGLDFSYSSALFAKTGVSKTGTDETGDFTNYQFKLVNRPEILIKQIIVKEVASVNFVYNDGTSSKVAYSDGATIEYPELTDGDYYTAQWSLSADEYVAVPETMGDADITVYEYRTKIKNIVSFVKNGATTEGYYEDEETIEYPTLTASYKYDYVWSLSDTEYIPVPATATDDIIVYAYKNPVISFENMPTDAYVVKDTQASSEIVDEAYLTEQGLTGDVLTGNNVARFRNYGVNVLTAEPSDWSKYSLYAEYDADTDSWVQLTEAKTFEAGKYATIRKNSVEQGQMPIRGFDKSEYKFAKVKYTSAPSGWLDTYDAEKGTISKSGAWRAHYILNDDGEYQIATEVFTSTIDAPGPDFASCEWYHQTISFDYKITFKYWADDDNTADVKVTPYLWAPGNIWWGSIAYSNYSITIPSGATDGWQTAEMYIHVENDYPASGTKNENTVLALKFYDTQSTESARNKTEIYVDDITITENYVNTPTVVLHKADGTTEEVTEGVTAGAAYTVPGGMTEIEGKMFAGWSTTADGSNIVSSVTMPASTTLCRVHLYEIVSALPTVVYHDGEAETMITDGVYVNTEYTIDRVGAGMDDMYFAGWSTTEAGTETVTSVTLPGYDPDDCSVHLYARYVDYVTDGSTYTYNYEGIPAINGVGYMLDGVYGDKITEGGSAGSMTQADPKPRVYSENGLELGRDTNGGANKWDVSKDGGSTALSQISSWSQVVADKSNVVVGETANLSWGEAQITVIRDKDGNVAVPKPKTKYAATITLKRIGAGAVSLYLVADRKAKYVTGDIGNSTNTSVSNVSKAITVPVEVNGEFVTTTVYFETGSYENSVPVLSLNMSSSLLGKRLESADGYESITVNGTTYFPYEIIDHGRVLIKEIQLTEVESGNTAITYNYYEEGVGFSAVLKDATVGTPIDVSTKNVDEKWYNNKAAQANQVVTTYPSADAIYYNATYMQTVAPENKFGNGCHNGQSEKVITFESTEVDVDGATDYALHISASDTVITNDQECMILAPGLQHGHTYKVSYKYKANAIGSRFGFLFRTAQGDNYWSGTANANLCTSYVAGATTGEWIEKAVYFTVDLLGTVAENAEENGIDYNLSRDSRNNLFITYLQDAGETANDLYFIDFKVEDLGEVVATDGASILTDEAAEKAGNKQAMRYYFTYETTNGSDITLGGETLEVVERGFLYRNGYLASGATESAKFRADNSAVLRKAKVKDFNICWAYADGVMTFSTYITGFELNDKSKKLEVKAYLFVKNSAGEQFYIYSDSINRTIAGVDGFDGQYDNDITLGQ